MGRRESASQQFETAVSRSPIILFLRVADNRSRRLSALLTARFLLALRSWESNSKAQSTINGSTGISFQRQGIYHTGNRTTRFDTQHDAHIGESTIGTLSTDETRYRTTVNCPDPQTAGFNRIPVVRQFYGDVGPVGSGPSSTVISTDVEDPVGEVRDVLEGAIEMDAVNVRPSVEQTLRST